MSAVIDKLLRPESGLSTRFFFLAKRFVAGEKIETALDAVRDLNADGIRASLDFSARTSTLARGSQRTKEAYITLLDAIRLRKADTNVSVKLTAMGLLFDEDLALANLNEILDAPPRTTIRSCASIWRARAVTAATLGLFERAYANHKNVGPVIAGLSQTLAGRHRAPDRTRRARAFVQRRIQQTAGRLHTKTCRRSGASSSLWPRACWRAVTIPGIATHDERIIEAVKGFVRGREIGKDKFEFQLLYGVKPATPAPTRQGRLQRARVRAVRHSLGGVFLPPRRRAPRERSFRAQLDVL